MEKHTTSTKGSKSDKSESVAKENKPKREYHTSPTGGGRAESLNQILTATSEHIARMRENEKTSLADLAKTVAQELNLPLTTVTPLVSFAVHSMEGVTVERGRYGGIFKGTRPKKEDNRERCATCHQVIRGKRKLKAKGQASATSSAEPADVSEEDEFEDEEGEDEGDEESGES